MGPPCPRPRCVGQGRCAAPGLPRGLGGLQRALGPRRGGGRAGPDWPAARVAPGSVSAAAGGAVLVRGFMPGMCFRKAWGQTPCKRGRNGAFHPYSTFCKISW